MTRTIFTGADLFDGTGAQPSAADLVIEDGRIVAVGTALDGDEQVDCTGHTILPGLFDCHVHLTLSDSDLMTAVERPFSLEFFEAAENMRRTLTAGITTVRDAAGADRGIREAQQRGLIAGPRVQVSLNMISQTGGHGELRWPSGAMVDLFPAHPGRPPVLVDGADQMRHKVRELIREGADVIKVATSGGSLSPGSEPWLPHFRDAEVATLVEEATAAGVFVMAHANGDGAATAVRNGIRSVEHGAFLDDATIEEMVERGTWLVPTLSTSQGILDAAEEGGRFPGRMLDKVRAMADSGKDSARRAIEAGVRIAMGTDAPLWPHGANLRELEHLVDCGLSPGQALVSATSSAAELMGLQDELGTLAPGKRADLVVVAGDPFEFGTLTERIRAVYQDGVVVHATAPTVSQ
ncbi:MAG: amidohydrolase family protein [Propionibacteriaceae bacterium]